MAKKTIVVDNAQVQATVAVVDHPRKLDKNYSGQKQMLAEGWTQAEIDALINAARSTPDTVNPEAWLPLKDGTDNVAMPDGAKWSFPKVDGFALCGTSLLTKEEKARYRAYVKARESGKVKSTSKKSVDMTKWNALLARLTELGDEQALAMFKELMPQDKTAIPNAYKKLTGRTTVDDTCWTWYGMMYRSPEDENGQRQTEPTLTSKGIAAKLEAGWEPVILQKQIRALLDECKEKGMKLDETSNGVIFHMPEATVEPQPEAEAQQKEEAVAEALAD